MSKFVKCQCTQCTNWIEFDETQAGQIVSCPHCGNEVQLIAPTINAPPILENASTLTIGDIAITNDKVITPNGIGNLAASQWIFSDMSRTESRIPSTAIILAIVFALLCLIGLLFLLMRETKITGYAEVSVHTGNLFHKVQIPVKSQNEINNIRDLVNKAQSLAMKARQ
jgi:hypothetical protein